MIISVASGKGGTGKTLVSTSLALALAEEYPLQLLDCDVEEPNDHIFLNPVFDRQESAVIPVPIIDEKKCTHCGECARVCPGQSIPFGEEEEIEGVKRWKIDSESCFTFWCQAGTDCGRCMIVCPFSHPDNWFHRFIRFGIRNNGLFRRLAIPLDDAFYGKRPRSRDMK